MQIRTTYRPTHQGNQVMQENQVALVQQSWKKVLPIRSLAAELFYTRLFELDPSLRAMFKGNMAEQGSKLIMMIGTAVAGLSRPSELIPAVEALGARHVDYGVKDAHYDTVGNALLDTLHKGLGDDFTSEVEVAWVAVYSLLATTMKDAAAKV